MKLEGDSAGPTIILKAGGVPSSHRSILIITKVRPPILGVGFGLLNGLSRGPSVQVVLRASWFDVKVPAVLSTS